MAQVNPFADFGTTVYGDRFVGRDDELRQIASRVFGKIGYGSLALVGLPKIGKTSLLAEAVRRAGPSLRDRKTVVTRVEMGTCQSIDDFFRTLIQDLVQGLRGQEWSNSRIEEHATRALERSPIPFACVRDVFRAVRQAGTRAVCILDEFDAGRYLFAGLPQSFHWLRELCSNPEFKAAVIFVSKRRLQDIARMAGHESDYWANVLMTLTLRPFSVEDTQQFFERARVAGVTTDGEALQEVTAVCGRHPYLLDAYAYHACQRVLEGRNLDIEWLRSTMGGVIHDYYHQVVTVLQDASMLDKFVQVVCGPTWNVRPQDVDALVDYGVLSIENQQQLRSFSEGFADYARLVEGSAGIWPLWRDTERSLRDSIDSLLRSRFGADWENELKKSRPKLQPLLDACHDTMTKEQARFGVRAAPTLLAYAYPMDLFQIMAADWSALGDPLLGPDKQAWSVKFGVLGKVRTPLAHNRDEAVTDGERLQAEGICKELLGRIRSWQDGIEE